MKRFATCLLLALVVGCLERTSGVVGGMIDITPPTTSFDTMTTEEDASDASSSADLLPDISFMDEDEEDANTEVSEEDILVDTFEVKTSEADSQEEVSLQEVFEDSSALDSSDSEESEVDSGPDGTECTVPLLYDPLSSQCGVQAQDVVLYPTGGVLSPGVMSLDDGTSIVVWAQEGGDLPYGVFAQRYDDTSTPIGTPFELHQTPGYFYGLPSITRYEEGGFVGVWYFTDLDYTTTSIVARRFNNNGTPESDEFLVESWPTEFTLTWGLDVASLSDGSLVVVWERKLSAIFGRRVFLDSPDSGGVFQISDLLEPESPGDSTTRCSVKALPDGAYVVVWSTRLASNMYTFARIYGSDNEPTGEPFLVHDPPEYAGSAYSVDVFPDGRFVIVWQSYTLPLPFENRKVLAQIFYPDGGTDGAPIEVMPLECGTYIGDVSVTVLGEGGFTTFMTMGQKYTLPSGETKYAFAGVTGCKIDKNGEPVGAPFALSGEPYTHKGPIDAEELSDGSLTVVWQDMVDPEECWWCHLMKVTISATDVPICE